MTNQYSFEVALDIITEGAIRGARSKIVADSEFTTQSFKTESAKQFEQAKNWTNGEGVQGFGIANKVSGGKRTDSLSLKVYVDRKKPLKDIKNPAPKYVDIPAMGRLDTDVEEIGVMAPEMFTTKATPMMPGCGVIHTDVTEDAGTFGCVVETTDSGDSDKYILSNAHVLAKKGMAQFNTNIIQPGTLDGGTAADAVAVLTSSEPFNFDPVRFLNKVDAAIARINTAKRTFSPNIRLLDHPPTGVARVTRIGMKVQKVGRTTDHTWGEILDVNFRLNLFYPSPVDGGEVKRVGFKDQVLCTQFTSGGDSGAAVLNQSGKIIGLHFAGSPSRSVFNKIGNVFEALQIRLPS